MGFLLLGCSLFLLIKAIYSICTNIFASFKYIKKIGQVVGFAEEKSGIFKVVIRFLGLDGQEYYLVDSRSSSAPPYAQGDFIRILLLKSNDKIGRLDHLTSLKKSIWYLVLGLLFFALVRVFYEVKTTHMITLFVAYLALSEIAKSYDVFRFFRFDVELPAAKIINIENSRLIPWSEKYIGHIEFESSFTFFIDYFLKLERLTYIFIGFIALGSSIYSFKSITEQVENSYAAKAIYDRAIQHQWTQNFKSKIPIVRYYDKKGKIVSALDTQNPFYFDLKEGSEVSILVSKSNPETIRIDRGLINYWKGYVLLVFALVFLKLNRIAQARNASLKISQPVIRVRKAG